jgi:methylmalonyl-CoA mutase cobalamin-binding subunit
MRLVFKLPDYRDYDYFITWRGGGRLWLPHHTPELSILKPELRFEVEEALRLGDTRLERLAAVSPRYWRELYTLSHFVDYGEPPEPPATMWYADQDLAAVAARHLSSRGFRVLLEVPALSEAQAALLAGHDVTVCVAVSSRGLEAADAVARQRRAAARAALRSINLLGGAWDERTLPELQRASDFEVAEFDAYASEVVELLAKLEPPEPRRQVVEMLAWAFGKELFAQAAEVLGEVASASLPLRSLPDLGVYWPVLRKLLLYGYVTAERDVLRATEKGVFAALEAGALAFRGGARAGEEGAEAL